MSTPLLSALPMIFILTGVVLYAVLAGADFGAGFWQLFAGRGTSAERVRAHAHHSMAPVWEANHVWLIFVLTVFWTAYPTALGSIASTLAVPLFLAGVGIVFRGAAYALRSGSSDPRELRMIDTVFSLSSLLVPFALGTVVGAIATGRVPVGNAAGQLITSWLSATSVLIGTMAIATSAYLAAVYLAADAARHDQPALEGAFRARALSAGVVAGGLAVAGLIVLHSDARHLYDELVAGDGLPALIVSVLAGSATLVLVYGRRFEPARFSAALAVAAIVAGWALAQWPTILPGLDVRAAAAPHDTLVAVVVVVLGGGAIVFPSLGLLFGLTLRGRFGEERAATPAAAEDPAATDGVTPPPDAGVHALAPAFASHATSDGEYARRNLLGRVAVACFLVGLGLLNLADARWAHAIGVVAFLAFIVSGFMALIPALL